MEGQQEEWGFLHEKRRPVNPFSIAMWQIHALLFDLYCICHLSQKLNGLNLQWTNRRTWQMASGTTGVIFFCVWQKATITTEFCNYSAVKYSHVSPVNIFDMQKTATRGKTYTWVCETRLQSDAPYRPSTLAKSLPCSCSGRRTYTHTNTHTDQCNTWRPHHNDTHASPHTYISRRACWHM